MIRNQELSRITDQQVEFSLRSADASAGKRAVGLLETTERAYSRILSIAL
jgi:hypothetical protein